MTATPGLVPVRSAFASLITMLGGVTLAVIPAATIAISARIFTTAEQGLIAVAVMVATFAGQLTFAVVVESRLSSAATERRVAFPRWLAVLSVLAGLAIVANPGNAIVLCVALPVLIAGLEVGRGVSVAERLDRRETLASITVGLGALAGVIAAFTGQHWALIPLVAGIAAATIVRALPVPHKPSRPDRAIMGWVLADTGITGVIYPLMNAMILTLIGPANAVQFAAIATVSGLLAIPLNFMRLRLLKEHSLLDIVVSAASVLAAVVVLVALEITGMLSLLFGDAWSGDGILLALLLACAWRAASLATTIPFASLRRRGKAKLVTGLRAIVSVLTLALASIGLLIQSLPAVFLGLLLAEAASAVIYDVARRRVAARTTTGADR